MRVELNDKETEAFIKLRSMLREASTPTPVFLHWVAERLISRGDPEGVDFVVKLRDYARGICEISTLLGIRTS